MNEVNNVRGNVYMPASSGKASSVPAGPFVEKSGSTLPPDASRKATEATESVPEGEFLQNVEQAVAHMNEYLQATQRDLHFSYDAESGDTIVRVVDSATQEVIRQIPDEIFLKLARELNAGEPVPLLQAQA